MRTPACCLKLQSCSFHIVTVISAHRGASRWPGHGGGGGQTTAASPGCTHLSDASNGQEQGQAPRPQQLHQGASGRGRCNRCVCGEGRPATAGSVLLSLPTHQPCPSQACKTQATLCFLEHRCLFQYPVWFRKSQRMSGGDKLGYTLPPHTCCPPGASGAQRACWLKYSAPSSVSSLPHKEAPSVRRVGATPRPDAATLVLKEPGTGPGAMAQ